MEKNIIAVFGGSFNPPTIAHINLAKQILNNIKNIEKVIFVPVSTKYSKSGLASDQCRFSMLKKICNNEKNIEVSSIELDSQRQLYTIETLEKLTKQNPENELYFVIGTDNLKELESWNNASSLLQKYKIIVLERDNDKMEDIIENNQFLKQNKNCFIKLDKIDKINLSSSYVRERIKNKDDIKGLVPKEIEEEILKIY